jgi:hypothetical protein
LKKKGDFIFIETYYDERQMVTASSREPAIPYPELAGEELSVWQRYLPVTTELGKVPFGFYHTPQPVIEQLEKAQKRHLFDRIEIWSRSDDPMTVGVMGGERTRYFSIARWGDAKLTLQQVATIIQLRPSRMLLVGP